jgi:recombinational DNA repair ATPase RecF
MSVFLHGFRINGYRSLSSDSYIGPFSKINLFVGINNSGKSNILQFIRLHLNRFIESAMHRRGSAELTGDNKTRGRSKLSFSLCTPHIGFADKSVRHFLTSAVNHSNEGQLSEFVRIPSITRSTELFWIDFDVLPEKGNIPNISENQLDSVVGEAGTRLCLKTPE